MYKQSGYTLIELSILVLILFGGIGWIWNIVKIVGSDFANITGLLVVRVIGIFIAPLGAIVGYL